MRGTHVISPRFREPRNPPPLSLHSNSRYTGATPCLTQAARAWESARRTRMSAAVTSPSVLQPQCEPSWHPPVCRGNPFRDNSNFCNNHKCTPIAKTCISYYSFDFCIGACKAWQPQSMGDRCNVLAPADSSSCPWSLPSTELEM